MKLKITAPLRSPVMHVEPGFIDYNGHMNLAYYQVLFDRHLDIEFERLGLGMTYLKEQQHSFFALEAHLSYRRELKLNDPVVTTFQLIDHDDKCMHFSMEMFHAEQGFLACATSQLSIHIDMRRRKPVPFLPEALAVVQALKAAHAHLPVSALAGRAVGIRRKV